MGLALLLLITALISGCLTPRPAPESLRGRIDVYGVELFSAADYLVIQGVTAAEEPCLRGYERSFDQLEVIVGYGFDKRIRKITSRNPQTSMFGVKPGMAFKEGEHLLLHSGFTRHGPRGSFVSDGYSLKLLVDGADTIFGMTVESLE